MLSEKDLEFANECIKTYNGLTDEEQAQTWIGMRNITQQWATGKIAQKGVNAVLIGCGIALVVIKIKNKRRERKAKQSEVIY